MSEAVPTLEDYRDVAPPGTVELLRRLSERVRGRRVLHVSTSGKVGGVAEILRRLVPLLEEAGVDAGWESLDGEEAAPQVAVRLHTALQGDEERMPPETFDDFRTFTRARAASLELTADVVVTHDVLPAALVDARPPEGAWVWRCHLDVSRPQRRAWTFLRQFVVKFDAAVFSLPSFAQRLPIPQFLVYPSIDPLSDKNRDLAPSEIDAILAQLGVPRDKPILLQVARFDRFKDPLGVIDAYRLVKRQHDCRLVLVGGAESDDPGGVELSADVREAASHDPDLHVLELPAHARREVNALQRAATIVFQKSTREGFGLGVAEAMWKSKPVIGGFAGGITAQVIYDVTGYTVNSVEGAAFRARQLLADPELCARLGAAGREHVRQNFLITRQLGDELALMATLLR
ncbi:MAG: glycosyltransferase [Deltaproteobacteria bacterium]|nr:MAG: glycosyltransferase [Deltaproteobacteria bacterium]